MTGKFNVKKYLLIILASLLWVSSAWAEKDPMIILEGPDVVQVGTSTTYSVSTEGGTDTSYTWWLGYTSNAAATIDESGVLTASNPGIAGIRVYGNDTGAMAELHVNVVSDTNASVVITGPDKVVIGTTETFSATTTGATGGNYYWFITYSSPSMIATLGTDTGELTGIGEGTVMIGVVDSSTGLSGSKTVDIVTSEKETAKVSITAGLGEGFTLQAILSIRGEIPEDAALYVAVKYDGAFHFLPSGTTTMTPFRTSPQETDLETVYSVPISSIPLKEYTFYAALLNSRHELVSNLSASAVIKAGGTTK